MTYRNRQAALSAEVSLSSGISNIAPHILSQVLRQDKVKVQSLYCHMHSSQYNKKRTLLSIMNAIKRKE